LLKTTNIDFENCSWIALALGSPELEGWGVGPGMSTTDDGLVIDFDGFLGFEIVEVGFAGVKFVAGLIVETGAEFGSRAFFGGIQNTYGASISWDLALEGDELRVGRPDDPLELGCVASLFPFRRALVGADLEFSFVDSSAELAVGGRAALILLGSGFWIDEFCKLVR
jgi:hypothetical protein